MSGSSSSSTLLGEVLLKHELQNELKIIIFIFLYTFYGCVICNEDEFHIKRTNEFPFIMIEYADYIFVYAMAVWSVRYFVVPRKRNIYKLMKFSYEAMMCVIFINIALKLVWSQLIEFSSILCTQLSSVVLKLHGITCNLDGLVKAAEILESENCGRFFLTLISLLVLFYVWETGYFANCLFNCVKDYFQKLKKKLESSEPSTYLPHCVDTTQNTFISNRNQNRGPRRRKCSQNIAEESELQT